MSKYTRLSTGGVVCPGNGFEFNAEVPFYAHGKTV